MDITYLGHSAFKLKGKEGTVVTDPFDAYVGFKMPSVSADLVTVSHQHKDHDAVPLVKPAGDRKTPFIIQKPGQYEVGGISVFGVSSFHDNSQGAERGVNTIFTIILDNMSVCHLGDLGHTLSAEQISEIGAVDILLCPVGDVFTINSETAVKVIQEIDPKLVIPMHYKTERHDEAVFGGLQTVETFLNAYGVDIKPTPNLKIDQLQLPEETEVVVLVS